MNRTLMLMLQGRHYGEPIPACAKAVEFQDGERPTSGSYRRD